MSQDERDEVQPAPVTIFGQSYALRSDQDPEYVRKLADYVDRKMREVAERTHTAETLKIAILATLNITDELFRRRPGMANAVKETSAPLQDQVLRIESILDEGLSPRS